MARFPEQRLWDRIRRNLGREIHIERIENSAKEGTPDTVVLHKSIVTFVEHKTAKLPKRKTTRLQWRHELTVPQRNWHRIWNQNGGTSYIVVAIGLSLHAVPGYLVDRINDMTLEAITPWHVTIRDLATIYRGENR